MSADANRPVPRRVFSLTTPSPVPMIRNDGAYNMNTFEHYLQFYNQPAEKFASAFPFPFLLMENYVEKKQDHRMFQTMQMQFDESENQMIDSLQKLQREGQMLDKSALRYRILEVKKKEDNPFPNMIFVGRTQRSDIPISHNGISKSHAFFELDDNLGQWYLTDNNSTNGTNINDTALAAQQKQAVNYGDIISFGTMKFKFVQADQIWKILQQSIVSKV
jgi:hypothetical protein